MLGYALRRFLWALPTLVGISVLVFVVTSVLPDPLANIDEQVLFSGSVEAYDATIEARRAHFLDLPRFFNAEPVDLKTRVEAAVHHVARNDASAAIASHELSRLGGAVLPLILPRLDAFGSKERGRIAAALAPIAKRMGLESPKSLSDPDEAVSFWAGFWQDRALEFTAPSVDRDLVRLLHHSKIARERDITEVDTYAMPAIMRELEKTKSVRDTEILTRLAAHVTGRGETTGEAPTPESLFRIRAEWRQWWYVHRADYQVLSAPERVAASITEARYGKWLGRAVTGELGISARDGRPVATKLVERAPLTLGLCALAILVGYTISVPLGVAGAWKRGKRLDIALLFLVFGLYAIPTFALAEVLAPLVPASEGHEVGRVVLAAFCLTISMVSVLSRYQRAAILEVLSQDYIRSARAKGVPRTTILLRHALRNALLPTVTLAGLQIPMLLGGAFVVEEIFDLPGLGWESLRAVEASDSTWLVGMLLFVACVATLGILFSDLLYGALDPRIREAKTARS